jgi:2,3-bisphosphoglycerate-independent phosphoglycerate mutase
MANFRSDRAREILRTLLDPEFNDFPRHRVPAIAAAIGMVEYSDDHNSWLSSMFPPVTIANGLGQVVADAGLAQLRIAETEKYAHVTFFFNGGQEQVLPGEQRELIPSPKVATYDLQPEMSAPEITDRLVAHIAAGTFDVIILNYANGDMVGHTGNLAAAQRAAIAIDACLDRLEQAIADAGGVMLITADHGNCEHMTDADGAPHTAHTTGPVPLVLVNAPAWVSGISNGRLCDIAPTMLELMGRAQPAEMTGRSLIQRAVHSVTEAA